ncbi:putative reverse transcriptase domain-containing protein [Tanacetum coccineum]
MDSLARLYLNEIVARHGVPISIISDRDSRFTLRFWQSMQKALRTRLDMSTAMVRASVLFRPWKTCSEHASLTSGGGSWDVHLPLVEFSYNNSYHSSKSYTDKQRKPLEFSAGDHVVLKVSPWKGVVGFGKKGKLAPSVHDTFHVSNLKKCLADPNLYVPLEEIQIDAKLNFMEEPVEILEREIKKLKRSRIPIVKVRWNLKRGPEFTWERED